MQHYGQEKQFMINNLKAVCSPFGNFYRQRVTEICKCFACFEPQNFDLMGVGMCIYACAYVDMFMYNEFRFGIPLLRANVTIELLGFVGVVKPDIHKQTYNK